MSKEIIDYGFGVIETRETFYTEETIRQQDYELYSRTDMWNKLIEQQDKIAELQQQLELTEKALELACEMMCGLTVWDELEFDKAIKDNCDYFKTKAKEMMKSE